MSGSTAASCGEPRVNGELYRALVLAGGTGGHVFPALAVARRLRERGWNVQWLGSAAGLEQRLVPADGIELHTVPVRGLRANGVGAWLRAPLMLASAMLRSGRVIRAVRPHLILGMGGFVSGPGGLAGWLLRVPVLVHEQNAVAGLTNRLLSLVAKRVLEAFPGSFRVRAGRTVSLYALLARRVGAKTFLTGNPVRAALSELPSPTERFAGRDRGLRILVLGGSQGARAINRVMAEAVAALIDKCGPDGVELRHQCGQQHIEETRQRFLDAGLEGRLERLEVSAFFDDMAEAYGWADVVVCRAGAMTVCEIAAVGVTTLFIPFPFAVDDHQTRNAEYLVSTGGAAMMNEADLDPAVVCAWLSDCLEDRAALISRAESVRARALPDATAQVVRHCEEVVYG